MNIYFTCLSHRYAFLNYSKFFLFFDNEAAAKVRSQAFMFPAMDSTFMNRPFETRMAQLLFLKFGAQYLQYLPQCMHEFLPA